MVATKLLTAEELEAMGTAAERLELVEGEVFEVAAAGGAHGIIGGRLIRYLAPYVDDAGLGEVLNAETGFVVSRNPDSVLMPDVSFVASARIPPDLWKSFVPFAPDLAVEMESPTNTQSELIRKVSLYLQGGSRLVWLIRPLPETVTVFRPEGPEQILRVEDTLDGGEVLPGFTLSLTSLFRR